MKTIILANFLILCFCINANKLFCQSVLMWEAQYNGGSNLSDKSKAIAIDQNCNTYIAGVSDSTGQSTNIVTIKYDFNGHIVWKNTFDGVAHLEDEPTDIKVDNNGNIYVCGWSRNLTSSYDYVTLKYTSSGNLALTNWPVIYNNNGTSGNLSDKALKLAINNSTGDVYVTGYSTNAWPTGSSQDKEDFFTIRYNANGDSLNAAVPIYIGGRNYGEDIKIDGSGNIWELGHSANYFNLHKCSSDLSLIQSSQLNVFSVFDTAFSLLFDNTGNALYMGILGDDILLAKCTSGNFNSWNHTYSRSASSIESAHCFVVDNSDNIYIAGSSAFNGNKDIWIIKCDPNGDTLWTKTYDDSIHSDDEALGVTLGGSSSSPDVYIIGSITNNSGNKDIAILKYQNNTTNNPAWVQIYDGSNLTDDVPTGIQKDLWENIYITGYSGSIGNEDFTTLKYSTSSFAPLVTSLNGDSLSVSTASSYQWFKDSILLPNETSQIINLLNPGNGIGQYYCIVTQNCNSYSSNVISATTVNIRDYNYLSNSFSISPNPVLSEMYIRNNFTMFQNKTVEIYDINGKNLAINLDKNISNENQLILNVSSLVNGIYFVKIQSNESTYWKKFIKQ